MPNFNGTIQAPAPTYGHTSLANKTFTAAVPAGSLSSYGLGSVVNQGNVPQVLELTAQNEVNCDVTQFNVSDNATGEPMSAPFTIQPGKQVDVSAVVKVNELAVGAANTSFSFGVTETWTH